ncbi:Crp/Fnr family transcriptional regulator [Ideonella sp. DXS22W]|uniref:Crp/Fnr family transcriptional regulator n=1 Tax=Pseudaquabacterium inlustre TaxID=2984192 RepID=A0ABU9CLX1_9BURK
MTEACPACGPAFASWLAAQPERQAAWAALPRRAVAAGEVLQAVGQPMAAVWFVEQGLLRSHFLDAQGRERNCAFHPEGQWAGMPPPRGAPVAASVAIEALEPGRLVALSHAALVALLQHQPGWQATLTDALVANLMAQSRREASLTMHSAEERYALFLAEQPDLAARLALHHVASYLGITNVALSRIRRRIRQRQAVPGLPPS